MKTLIHYLASLPHAWVSIIGGIIGAHQLHSALPINLAQPLEALWSSLIPAAIATIMTLRIGFSAAPASEHALFQLWFHRRSAGDVFFFMTLALLAL